MDMGTSVRDIGSLREWIQAKRFSQYLASERPNKGADEAIGVRGFRQLKVHRSAAWRASLVAGSETLHHSAIAGALGLTGGSGEDFWDFAADVIESQAASGTHRREEF